MPLRSAALTKRVFVVGIGERAAAVPQRISAGPGFLGIELDAARNAAQHDLISIHGSQACVGFVHTTKH